MPEKKTLGRLPREAIRLLDLPRLPAEIVRGFEKLIDLTGTLSDAFDELGIVGVVSAYELPPVTTGTRIVGPALTVRNIRHAAQIHKALGAASTVLNVGAGAGSYEPRDRAVTAVEPSAAMRAQRPVDIAVAIDAVAERLPFPDGHFDASMATT